MNSVDRLDLARPWTQPCGSCDFGLPTSCTCPQGDPRIVVSALFAEIEQLRATLDRTHVALTRITDADDDAFTALDSTVEYVVRRFRQLAAENEQLERELEDQRRQTARLRMRLDGESDG